MRQNKGGSKIDVENGFKTSTLKENFESRDVVKKVIDCALSFLEQGPSSAIPEQLQSHHGISVNRESSENADDMLSSNFSSSSKTNEPGIHDFQRNKYIVRSDSLRQSCSDINDQADDRMDTIIDMSPINGVKMFCTHHILKQAMEYEARNKRVKEFQKISNTSSQEENGFFIPGNLRLDEFLLDESKRILSKSDVPFFDSKHTESRIMKEDSATSKSLRVESDEICISQNHLNKKYIIMVNENQILKGTNIERLLSDKSEEIISQSTSPSGDTKRSHEDFKRPSSIQIISEDNESISSTNFKQLAKEKNEQIIFKSSSPSLNIETIDEENRTSKFLQIVNQGFQSFQKNLNTNFEEREIFQKQNELFQKESNLPGLPQSFLGSRNSESNISDREACAGQSIQVNRVRFCLPPKYIFIDVTKADLLEDTGTIPLSFGSQNEHKIVGPSSSKARAQNNVEFEGTGRSNQARINFGDQHRGMSFRDRLSAMKLSERHWMLDSTASPPPAFKRPLCVCCLAPKLTTYLNCIWMMFVAYLLFPAIMVYSLVDIRLTDEFEYCVFFGLWFCVLLAFASTKFLLCLIRHNRTPALCLILFKITFLFPYFICFTGAFIYYQADERLEDVFTWIYSFIFSVFLIIFPFNVLALYSYYKWSLVTGF